MEVKVKLLRNGYDKSDDFYEDFKENRILNNDEYFTEETVSFPSNVPFPIYMGKGNEEQKKEQFLEAFKVLSENYISSERDIHLDEKAWHSFLVTHLREYIIEKYPIILENQKEFSNIVTKKFDWENYIYKCVLATEYVEDASSESQEKLRYYNLIVDNLDLYNYIIKYEVFRNGDFLLKILNVVDELGISSIMKAKIKDRPELGKDERYGRRVIFELNKAYPVVMAPMLELEDLKEAVLKELGNYYDVSHIIRYL
ncbi:MAG: hypothetical protein N2B06_00975 [Clostridium sp.]